MNALVTGGGGFIGFALVNELVRRDFNVTSFSRGDYPELRKIGVKTIRGDLSDLDSVLPATVGTDIIFHVAAKAGTSGLYREYYKTNVTGTENIIHSCKINKIKYLIYTSSASVVFDSKDIEGSDESLSYPVRPASCYTATKALAEKLILNANCSILRTVSLRPHLVYGPGDNHLLPGIISKAANGGLRRIGKCKNFVDVSYIDNVVAAHINAAKAIMENPEVSGQVFFITNGEPVLLWDFIDMILQASGLDPVKKRIPASIAIVISHMSQAFNRAFIKDQESILTPFIVSELIRSHWFNISRARKYLNYNPVISNFEGLRRMVENRQK
jgi:nucleoside-diphosphate-sugar epimerase